MSEKRCNDCGETKPRTEFYRSARQHDGLSTYCKPCTKARVYAYRAAQPERVKETMKRHREKHAEAILERQRAYVRSPDYPAKRKAYRAANPEYREKSRLASKEWWAKMTEDERREYIRQKNAKVPLEKRRRYARAYDAKYPEKRAAFDARKHAKRKGAPVVEVVDRQVVWERDGGICGICGHPADPESWQLDHIVPVIPRPGQPQGEHSYANTRVSHAACNARKGNRAA